MAFESKCRKARASLFVNASLNMILGKLKHCTHSVKLPIVDVDKLHTSFHSPLTVTLLYCFIAFSVVDEYEYDGWAAEPRLVYLELEVLSVGM